MKHGRMQRKDIPDDTVIQAITNTTRTIGPGNWRMWGDVLEQFDLLMPGVPRSLVYAKVHRMHAMVHACVHRAYSSAQCRGDVHLAEECTGC